MGHRPSPDHEIDRIDGNRDYTPSNCRWATNKEQRCNQPNTVWLTHQGLTMTMSDWASRVGISVQLLHYRLKVGWSLAKALGTPAGVVCRRPYKYTDSVIAEIRLRVANGEPQVSVARSIGVDAKYVSRIVTGKARRKVLSVK
jgi:hypothetical protein